ncbi:MAG: hypothetical protein CM15mP32_2460 [Flavobacteriaceae bacterium]|nr:MAG: hypothetical protein CM15mP32_2460 [Flavobacteriaceae bacterium]
MVNAPMHTFESYFLTGQYPFRHGWVNHYDVPRWGHGVNFDSNKNPSYLK